MDLKKAVYKVPNGKLLKIFVEDEGSIKSIKITGDFFAHPEENIQKLEESLENCELSESELKVRIDDFFTKNPTALFGVDSESIARTIINAK